MEFNGLRGAAWRDGEYVHYDAARGQAFGRPLARFWSAPPISRRNCAMMTRVVAEWLAVCFTLTCRCSMPEVPRSSSSDGPWVYNAVLSNVVGLAVFGVAKTYDGGVAPHLCVAHRGTTPLCGKLHLCFPSDARPRCSADGYIAVCQILPSEGAESLHRALCDRRSALEREWTAGACSPQFEFVTGCPVRFYIGGAGVNRILVVCPHACPPCDVAHDERSFGQCPRCVDGHGGRVLLGPRKSDAARQSPTRWWRHGCVLFSELRRRLR